MPARGSFVDYCIGGGEYRPALVVREWSPDGAQLQVFTDKANDGADPLGFDWFRSSASRGTGSGTWRDLPIPISFTVHAPAVPMFRQDRCNCGDTWNGTAQKPPCPVHGWNQGGCGMFEIKDGAVYKNIGPANATATAAPVAYLTPTEGYPR